MLRITWLTLGAATLLAGCGIQQMSGRDFPIAAVQSLHLRQTSVAEAEAALGPPFKQVAMQGTVGNPASPLPQGSAISFTLLTYTYGSTDVGIPYSERSQVKNATLAFFNGRLTAYDITDTLPGESLPPVDQAKLGNLQNGLTTREAVIALLGPPTGQSVSLPPMKTGGLAEYNSSETSGGTTRTRRLRLNFDAADVLTQYAFTDSSGPAGQPLAVTPPVPFTPYIPPVRPPNSHPFNVPKVPSPPHT